MTRDHKDIGFLGSLNGSLFETMQQMQIKLVTQLQEQIAAQQPQPAQEATPQPALVQPTVTQPQSNAAAEQFQAALAAQNSQIAANQEALIKAQVQAKTIEGNNTLLYAGIGVGVGVIALAAVIIYRKSKD